MAVLSPAALNAWLARMMFTPGARRDTLLAKLVAQAVIQSG
ncbi:MAG: hypothetical protein ABI977_35130 [Acidobacteriota bacterium]